MKVFEQGQAMREQGNISVLISKEDFITYWKRVWESTASSIFTLHFGCYKVTALDEDLSKAHAILLDMATRLGCSLPRWQQGLTVMLEKKPGCILVEKLRAILLMEADFGMVNKFIVGSRMMKQAKALEEMPWEQSGGRKNHSADEAALN